MQYTIPLTKWEKMMVDYGFFHQNTINLITHFIGVPIIVASVFVPLTWLQFFSYNIGGTSVPVTMALPAAIALAVFYISLDRKLGWFSVPFIALVVVAAHLASTLGIGTSGLYAAIGFFGGFALQFIGHAIEGKKPALAAYNPIVAMLTSPLFVVAELGVKFGIQKELFEKVAEEISRIQISEQGAPPPTHDQSTIFS